MSCRHTCAAALLACACALPPLGRAAEPQVAAGPRTTGAAFSSAEAIGVEATPAARGSWLLQLRRLPWDADAGGRWLDLGFGSLLRAAQQSPLVATPSASTLRLDVRSPGGVAGMGVARRLIGRTWAGLDWSLSRSLSAAGDDGFDRYAVGLYFRVDLR